MALPAKVITAAYGTVPLDVTVVGNAVAIVAQGQQFYTLLAIASLNASGATLALDASTNGGSTWSPATVRASGSMATLASTSLDGSFFVTNGAATHFRWQVVTAGLGQVTVGASGGADLLNVRIVEGGSGGGGTPTGSAGTPNAAVVTVQGIPGGTPQSVSQSSGPWTVSWSGQTVASTQSGTWTVALATGTTVTVGGAAPVGSPPGVPPVPVSGVDGAGLKRHILTDTAGVVSVNDLQSQAYSTWPPLAAAAGPSPPAGTYTPPAGTRNLSANVTAAGNISMTDGGGNVKTFPLSIGFQSFPFLPASFTTTATATFWADK